MLTFPTQFRRSEAEATGGVIEAGKVRGQAVLTERSPSQPNRGIRGDGNERTSAASDEAFTRCEEAAGDIGLLAA